MPRLRSLNRRPADHRSAGGCCCCRERASSGCSSCDPRGDTRPDKCNCADLSRSGGRRTRDGNDRWVGSVHRDARAGRAFAEPAVGCSSTGELLRNGSADRSVVPVGTPSDLILSLPAAICAFDRVPSILVRHSVAKVPRRSRGLRTSTPPSISKSVAAAIGRAFTSNQ